MTTQMKYEPVSVDDSNINSESDDEDESNHPNNIIVNQKKEKEKEKEREKEKENDKEKQNEKEKEMVYAQLERKRLVEERANEVELIEKRIEKRMRNSKIENEVRESDNNDIGLSYMCVLFFGWMFLFYVTWNWDNLRSYSQMVSENWKWSLSTIKITNITELSVHERLEINCVSFYFTPSQNNLILGLEQFGDPNLFCNNSARPGLCISPIQTTLETINQNINQNIEVKNQNNEIKNDKEEINEIKKELRFETCVKIPRVNTSLVIHFNLFYHPETLVWNFKFEKEYSFTQFVEKENQIDLWKKLATIPLWSKFNLKNLEKQNLENQNLTEIENQNLLIAILNTENQYFHPYSHYFTRKIIPTVSI